MRDRQETAMHVRDRRKFVLGSAAALAAAALPGKAVMAQLTGDASTMRIVVPFSAAGPTDFIARLFAQALAEELKATVIVENKRLVLDDDRGLQFLGKRLGE